MSLRHTVRVTGLETMTPEASFRWNESAPLEGLPLEAISEPGTRKGETALELMAVVVNTAGGVPVTNTTYGAVPTDVSIVQ